MKFFVDIGKILEHLENFSFCNVEFDKIMHKECFYLLAGRSHFANVGEEDFHVDAFGTKATHHFTWEWITLHDRNGCKAHASCRLKTLLPKGRSKSGNKPYFHLNSADKHYGIRRNASSSELIETFGFAACCTIWKFNQHAFGCFPIRQYKTMLAVFIQQNPKIVNSIQR